MHIPRDLCFYPYSQEHGAKGSILAAEAWLP